MFTDGYYEYQIWSESIMSHKKWNVLFKQSQTEKRVPRIYEAVEMTHETKMRFIRAFSHKLGNADWCRANNLLLQRIIND